MTISTHPVSAGAAQGLLNSFRDSASQGETLQVVCDGASWKVEVSGNGHFAAPSEYPVDTTAVFIATLGQVFSPGIQEAVVHELGLAPRPGEPLASRLVLRAIAMAENSRQALEGVDFMTRLMFSAATNSEGFISACRASGLSPEALDARQRAAIDAGMLQRFAQAQQQGQSPVAPGQAQQWLQAALAAFKA